MKIILGLGNPGREYEQTRHNVGWWVVDHLADVWHFDGWRRNADAQVSSGRVGARQVRLVKPLTYMNLSGSVLTPYLRRPFWSPASDLLAVVDDVALPVGRFRLRASGSAGGHNGLKSLERTIGSRDYARLRVGIRPAEPGRETGVMRDFVLSSFGKGDRSAILELLPRLAEAAELWLDEGIESAMNRFNREPATP
ncbi:MAG: aminoacyl-tRNA hydrolase [Gemmatimonadota bacterium]|nr:aminoacyl-tRNA hydrolase [Gemmatimonadota bacterium]